MKTEDLIIAYMKAHKEIESDIERKAIEAKAKLHTPVIRKGKT